MFYRLMKFIIPFMCVAALLIFLSGNDDLFENFTMNFLTRLSKTEIKNPANDLVEALAIFDKFRNLPVDAVSKMTSGDIFGAIGNLFQLFYMPITIFIDVVRVLGLIIYDVLFNIVQIIKLLVDTTGVGMLSN